MANVRLLPNAPRAGLLAALFLSLAGCCDLLVRRLEPLAAVEDALARRDPAEELSPEAVRTLKEHELLDVCRRTPIEAHQRLQEKAVAKPEPDVLLALAEVSHALARRAEKGRPDDARTYHYLSAGYAYHYLLRGAGRDASACLSLPDESDLRFRQGRELYNAGLAGWLRAVGCAGRAEPATEKPVPPLPVVRHGFAWKAEEFGPLLFCADHRPAGERTGGLGVPLICQRAEQLTDAEDRAVRYPRGLTFPVTAFLRFEGGVAELAAARAGQLELYNPLAAHSVEMGGRVFPLAADLGTPLTYFRKHTDLAGVGDLGFLNPDKLRERRGVYFLEPYQPGKVPVLLVHGIRSSPATWLPLLRELRADSEVRERYQFWLYLYPTGDQYLKAAADLRRSLSRLREELDPQRRDAAWEQMVVAGHSMGGLIARLLTVDSGDDFWQRVSSRPLDGLRVSAETETELRRMFFFEREPAVRRVVFIATPHHGSKLSASLPARLTKQFAHPPRVLQEAARELVRGNPGLDPVPAQRLVPGSDHMAPGAPFLEALAARPRSRDVTYHSIIGVAPLLDTVLERTLAGSSWEEKSDGVVPATSARLKDADSEVVVPADHTQVKQHPRTVAEVKRILREHAAAVSKND
jgi:pimeloyl-ACP methyl ester carboxylesterase